MIRTLWQGSVNNRMAERTHTEPKVGGGATLLACTDRYAGTVLKDETTRLDGRIVTVQEDKATRTDDNGLSESQSYSYEPNPKGSLYYFKLTHDRWVEVYRSRDTNRFRASAGGCGVNFGYRAKYDDPSY